MAEHTRRVLWAAMLDVASILVFVAIGRRNHEEGSGVGGVLETAAPFLIALAAGWLLVRAWRWPTAILTGLFLWPVTILLGMILRNAAFDRGTAVSFVIVATLFLGACLVGWRTAYGAIARRRRQNSTAIAGTS
jgi:hypothetical protein